MWEKGGNEYGNQAFIHWGNVRSKSNDELTETEREWIVRRERFMERHEKDFRINGVVAVMKWGGIVQEGMKELIKENTEKGGNLMEKEIKSLTIEFKAKEEGLIEGYAAYFNNVDSYDDVIVPGAFQKTIKENMQDIKMVWNHDWDDVPIGNIIELKEDEKGLYFMAKLNNTTLAQDIKEAIKTGAVNKMSIGFRCTQYENKETDGKWIRYIKEIKLYEISPVNFPANDMATINSYKSKELKSIREIIKEELKKANELDEVMLKINNLIKKTGGKE